MSNMVFLGDLARVYTIPLNNKTNANNKINIDHKSYILN